MDKQTINPEDLINFYVRIVRSLAELDTYEGRELYPLYTNSNNSDPLDEYYSIKAFCEEYLDITFPTIWKPKLLEHQDVEIIYLAPTPRRFLDDELAIRCWGKLIDDSSDGEYTLFKVNYNKGNNKLVKDDYIDLNCEEDWLHVRIPTNKFLNGLHSYLKQYGIKRLFTIDDCEIRNLEQINVRLREGVFKINKIELTDWEADSLVKVADKTHQNEYCLKNISKPIKRGRKSATENEIANDNKLYDDWLRAKNAKVSKEKFALGKGISVQEVDKILDRVSKRKKRQNQ